MASAAFAGAMKVGDEEPCTAFKLSTGARPVEL
jgi:hypothetical protein